jgi:hypothetical protein
MDRRYFASIRVPRRHVAVQAIFLRGHGEFSLRRLFRRRLLSDNAHYNHRR